ncbi:MsnO8 family LLM class oxidoreductase [Oceanimonas sp. NS1]|nr:MsnO8 family LLM class oxidoreductase [Oceanimonas sp. NS1]
MSLLSQVKLSLLDLVHIRAGHDAADALSNSVALARHVEALGFERFWLAEHHNLDGIASSATAVLVGHIAGQTQRIRVGSGGIMLPNHPPLVVAEQFGTLATPASESHRLGSGPGSGTDPRPCAPLRRRPEDGEDFPEQVQQLQQLLAPARHGQKLMAIPGRAPRCPSGCWAPACSVRSSPPGWACPLPLLLTSHRACCLRRADCIRSSFSLRRCSTPPT